MSVHAAIVYEQHIADLIVGDLQGDLLAVGVQRGEIVAAGCPGIGEAGRHLPDRHHEDIAFIGAADIVVARLLRVGGRVVARFLRISRGVVVAAAAASCQQEGGGDTQSEGL